jgi:CRISPR type IV-associated protein Csf3
MTPLRVTAELASGLAMSVPLALDALLGAAMCQRDGIPPAATAEDLVPLAVPLEREPGERFYLASCALGAVERVELQHTHRRFPVEQAQLMGRQMGTLKITAGPAKSYRIPREVAHVVGDRLDWYAVGDVDAVRELLGWVTHLGRKRSVGLGRVRAWTVAPCDSWGEGFPVVRDGVPLRPLPADYPGVRGDWPRQMGVVDMPYWLMERSEPCVQPKW